MKTVVSTSQKNNQVAEDAFIDSLVALIKDANFEIDLMNIEWDGGVGEQKVFGFDFDLNDDVQMTFDYTLYTEEFADSEAVVDNVVVHVDEEQINISAKQALKIEAAIETNITNSL